MTYSIEQMAQLAKKFDKMGWDADRITKLGQANARVYRAIEYLLNGKPIEEAIKAAALMQVETEYPRISVDPTLTFEERVTAGGYDWRNSDLTETRYPVNDAQHGDWETDLIAPVNGEFTVPAGWQKAEIGHILAYGAAFPEMQRKYYLVATGSVAQVIGNRYCPILYQNASMRGLGLGWIDSGFGSRYRLLVVRRPLAA